MALIDKEHVRVLVELILQNIKADFANKKLSGNLINTLEVEETAEGMKIKIPAQTYNMLLYQTQGVVVHYGTGSYASKLDAEGSSFMVYPYGTKKGGKRISPRNHKDFVDKAIRSAVTVWVEMMKPYYKTKGINY